VSNTGASNIYIIQQTTSYLFFRRPKFPLTRTLFITLNRTIDLLFSRLLAIYRACLLILYLSSAGEFINKVIRDIDEKAVESDGTTELEILTTLRLRQ
jgi:hypothetical protein